MNKLLLVLGVVLLASLGKLNNAFVWDDIPLLVKSDLLYDWANLPVIFGHDTMYAADGGAFAKQAQLDTYRPITLLTFMLDAHLGGRDPLVFHLSSLLYHLLAVAALWLLLARLWRADWAWLPAACFGLHPLLGEAHLWINGRSDVLAGLFGFTALWLSLGRGWRPALGGALFLLGLMSKEVLLMALPVWALAMAWGWGAGFSRARLKAAAWALSPLILAALLYLGARAAALGGLKSSGGPEHLLMALGRVGWLLLDGLQSLALPLDTSLRYLMEDYARHATARFALSWLALLLALAALLRWRRRAPLVLIGLSLYAALLAPAALITGLRWYGFGRYLYLPFAGLLLALAPAVEALLSRRPQRQRPLAALMAIYLLGCGARLYVSADQWDGDLSMYEAIIAAQPDSSHGYGGVGRMLIEAGNYPAAAEMLIKASDHNPQDPRHLYNLAQAFLRGRRPREAYAVALQGIQRFPTAARFQHAAAQGVMNHDPQRALRHLLRGLTVAPDHAKSAAMLQELLRDHPWADRYRAALVALKAAPPPDLAPALARLPVPEA